ncbi:uncharacterized protein V6R79_018111 [Siganus canaliculatus]
MDEVVILISDSDESVNDSDVEIVGSFGNPRGRVDLLPLAAVRVDVGDLVNTNVPKNYIDLADPRWALPELKFRGRLNTTSLAVVDLTENGVTNGMEQKTEDMPVDTVQHKKDRVDEDHPSNQQQSSPREPSDYPPRWDFDNIKSEWHCMHPPPKHQLQTQSKTTACSIYLTKDCSQVTLKPKRQKSNTEGPECFCNMQTATASSGSHMELSQSRLRLDENSKEHIAHEDVRNGLCSSIPSPTSASSPHDKTLCSNLDQSESDVAEDRQNHLCDQPCPNSLARPDMDSLSKTSSISHHPMRQTSPTTSEHAAAEGQFVENEADETSNTLNILDCNKTGESLLPVCEPEDMDDVPEMGMDEDDLELHLEPVSFSWQEDVDEDQLSEESRFDVDRKGASGEDRHFVCPNALRKVMSGPAYSLRDEDEESPHPTVLCNRSLSLVYITIDENYTEGTLQLLSDLLQPGYYPPRDITLHLLRSILLDPQCPYHQCVQAFNLLMRTQRHHKADRHTVPWDWGLLISVMDSQVLLKHGYRCEVVRMLLEYVVQTLEDDFQAKYSTLTLHHSIAKTILSCDQQFPRVREVIKWLFSAIMKSTDCGETKEAARERDEQNRIVSIFQRMLSLALEVDRSPALISTKLSQELFHMLIGRVALRAHRMLLLESLQSKLLRSKLLHHLLDYACPVKTHLPMSLSLLLHFMKTCTLALDPMDGTEKWRRWEELVHLLWMLLLSYSKAMKGHLCRSATEKGSRAGTLVYKQDDKVSRHDVREAVEILLSRSQTDLGQALPLHVEESLTYLQDHLLDVCQC